MSDRVFPSNVFASEEGEICSEPFVYLLQGRALTRVGLDGHGNQGDVGEGWFFMTSISAGFWTLGK